MIYEFAATQDLHGWGKPWAPGAGKNLLDIDSQASGTISGMIVTSNTDYLIINGKKYGSSYNPITSMPITLPAGTYYVKSFVISGDKSATGNFNVELATDFSNIFATLTITSEKEFILESETTFYICLISSDNAEYFDYTVGVVISETSGITEYIPYANICMPEGFNIWDPEAQDFIQVYAGYVNANTRELYLRPVYEEYAGEELVGPWMSSLDEYSEDATPTEGAFVIDFGGELTSYEITPFMLQTLLDSLGIRQHFTNGAGLLNSLMDQAQGRVRSEEELLHLSRPLKVIAIGDQLPAGLTFKPISKDVLPGLPGKFIR